LEDIAVYILAGGISSRMGTDKGLMLLSDKPMIQYIIDTVSPLTESVSIISNNDAYKIFGFTVYSDLIKDKGPIGGIYTALSNSNHELNLVLSCDTPFVSLKLIQKLIDKCRGGDVCIPSFKGRVHPLIGVYKKLNTEIYKNAIDTNMLKLINVNEKLNTLVIEVENEFNEKNFINLNTKNELNKCV